MKDKIIAFLTTYGPYLAAALPSIIVGLTKMPDADKEGTVLNTIVKWLKLAMQLGSIVTHKDQEGTFKPPLTATMKRKQKAVSHDNIVVSAVLLILTSLFALQACAAWKANSAALKKDITDCAIEAARSGAPDLLPQIYKILEGDESTWGAALDAIKGVGGDALDCALMAAYHDLFMQEKKATSDKMMVAHIDLLQKKRAFIAKYIGKRGTVFGFKKIGA